MGLLRAISVEVLSRYSPVVAFSLKRPFTLAIVDPGVGSSRAAIAVQTERYHFVAPDNGVLSWILSQ